MSSTLCQLSANSRWNPVTTKSTPVGSRLIGYFAYFGSNEHSLFWSNNKDYSLCYFWKCRNIHHISYYWIDDLRRAGSQSTPNPASSPNTLTSAPAKVLRTLHMFLRRRLYRIPKRSHGFWQQHRYIALDYYKYRLLLHDKSKMFWIQATLKIQTKIHGCRVLNVRVVRHHHDHDIQAQEILFSGKSYLPGMATVHPAWSLCELQLLWSLAEEQQRRQNRRLAGSTLKFVMEHKKKHIFHIRKRSFNINLIRHTHCSMKLAA